MAILVWLTLISEIRDIARAGYAGFIAAFFSLSLSLSHFLINPEFDESPNSSTNTAYLSRSVNVVPFQEHT